MGFLDNLKEWTPEKTEKPAPTNEQKSFMNELLGAFGYAPHFAIETPPAEVTPPAKAETPAATADAVDEPRPPSREDFELLQSKIDKLAAMRDASTKETRAPELDEAQRIANDRAALVKRSATAIARQREIRDERAASKLLRKAGL